MKHSPRRVNTKSSLRTARTSKSRNYLLKYTSTDLRTLNASETANTHAKMILNRVVWSRRTSTGTERRKRGNKAAVARNSICTI
eukprot:8003784-Pyramimonas_sp.AAC.1